MKSTCAISDEHRKSIPLHQYYIMQSVNEGMKPMYRMFGIELPDISERYVVASDSPGMIE